MTRISGMSFIPVPSAADPDAAAFSESTLTYRIWPQQFPPQEHVGREHVSQKASLGVHPQDKPIY